MRDSKIFDQSVSKFFEPIAQELDLQLVKVKDGVYEMPSSYFIMRVRLHTGHARGLNVMLRPASLRNFEENDPGSEYGIRCFIEFQRGLPDQTFINIFTDEDFIKQTELLAQATRRYLIPYLLGQKNDFEALRKMIKKRTEDDTAKLKSYHYPKNIRQEWKVKPQDE